MKVGVVFPQTEIGTDPTAIRDYGQAAEGLGYSHLLVYDHVLGAGTESRPNWRGPYTSDTPFHEPFVLFGYLAAITERIELVTGVIILPQRQTALVAKQAAEVDILSGGRLRLGVGVGWNAVEYEGLGQNFNTRGKRIEEQITLLRQLWAATTIDFKGQWDTIPHAGINPLPPRHAVPIWIGGGADAVLRRIGRIGDGWFPQMKPQDAHEPIERLRGYTQEAGRDPQAVGVEARINLREGNPQSWGEELEAWQKLGATHLGVNTMGLGLASAEEQIRKIEEFRKDLGL